MKKQVKPIPSYSLMERVNSINSPQVNNVIFVIFI
jgi:hypothetical protein